jgi:periplasmic protein CpxP/Spy
MEAKHTLFGGRTLAALALSALISAAPALAQQTSTDSTTGQAAQSSTTTGKAHRKHGKMAKELGLTADQKKQLKSLRQDQKKQIDAVRNDASLSQEQKAAKMKEIHKAGMEKRDSLLTPEQREKMQHLRDENEAKEGGARHHHRKSGMSTPAPAPEQAPQTPPTK